MRVVDKLLLFAVYHGLILLYTKGKDMDFDINKPNGLYHKDTEIDTARSFFRGLILALICCILFWSIIIYLIHRYNERKESTTERETESTLSTLQSTIGPRTGGIRHTFYYPGDRPHYGGFNRVERTRPYLVPPGQ